MIASKTDQKVCGIAIVDDQCEVILRHGIVNEDSRIEALISDSEWMAEAGQRRLNPVLFTNRNFVLLVTPAEGGSLVLVLDEPGDTTLKFLLGVDFASDILEHLLTDPYDAMAVVNDREELVFVSPVHEKFFGLRPGEGVGRHVKDVIQNTRLAHVVRTGVAEIGQIQKMNGRERVVSRHPIRRDGKIVGAIGRVMFKGPQQVEAMAKRINVLEREIATIRHEVEISQKGEAFLEAIVGNSPAVQAVREQIRKVAPLDIPVLIQGDSGTGKELVAQALHMLSARRNGRLISVNAAALPATLVESELFGYEAGAFTGADRKGRAGKFEQAHKGTIFLDEIGDMPLEVQSKMLRVLQDRLVERVGGDKPKKIDFRLCSATNRDLEEFVNLGKFRLDLFYRISPVVIMMPTLADRIEDIPLLVAHFLNDLAQQYARPVPDVSADVMDYLMGRRWPGNIRELRHVVERAFVFCEDNRLRVANFNGAGHPERTSRAAPITMVNKSDKETLREVLEKVESDLLTNAMIRFNGNKKKVAEHLGISRSYLYKKLGD